MRRRDPVIATGAVLVLLAATLVGGALGTAAVQAQARQTPAMDERAGWAEPFDQAGVRGTFVLLDTGTGRLMVHDPGRANTRFIPASTFKIMNSLVSLETGVIESTSTVLPFDGRDGGRPEIAHDMDMREAIRLSAVWFYQELARRVGAERMGRWLELVGYGNRKVTPRVDRFWLDGDLRISAVEQVRFVDRLRREDLPLSPATMRAVHDILVVERAEGGATLRAKTGWGRVGGSSIGWYVGWVEPGAGKAAHVFAMNIDIESNADARARLAITRAILAAEGLFPAPAN